MHMMPLFGNIKWDDFMRSLIETGFEGVLSLETKPPERLPDDIYEKMCVVLSEIIQRIAGAEYI